MLHDLNDIIALSLTAWSRRRVEELFHPPSAVATLPATCHATDVWPGEVVSAENPEHWDDRGPAFNVRVAPAVSAFPTGERWLGL